MVKGKISRWFICMILLGLVSLKGYSQVGSARGVVYDEDNGEPLMFTSVYLVGTTYGSTTDLNGIYNITKIPSGNYTLQVTYLGYDTLTVPVKIEANKIFSKNFNIKKSSKKLGMVVVTGKQVEKETKTIVSVTKIDPTDIYKIPTIGGDADIAQYLQILPGVIFTGDQGGQLYIRGGSPIQNKVLLDGMVVYNPFHSIGLFSVFDTDIIRNVEVYTGGFGAKYGGRISSIMDFTTRDGNKKRISGKVSGSTFGSKLLLEGPLKKKTEGAGSTSFLFSGKTSYLDKTSKTLYNYIDSTGLPYSFNDFYGKVSFNGDNGSKLNLFGFNFTDKVKYQGISDLDWGSIGIGSNFILIPSGSPTIINGNFAYSGYDIELAEADGKPRKSSINGFNMGLGFSYFLGKDEINYGIEVLGFGTNFEFFNPVNRKISQEESTTELGGYVRYKMVKDKFVFEPSFRAHYYASLGNFSPEPRLAMKYNASPKLRAKFAGGFYAQNLISANSDRNVVNLFYGFLSGPDRLPEEFDGNPVKHKLQKARHAVLGFEYDLTSRLELNVEGYHKRFSQLTNINRNKVFDDDGENADKPDQLKKDFIIESGNAYGVDFVLKFDNKKTYFWAVYSYSFVDRYDGIVEYRPHFDHRHNVNLVSSHKFGKKDQWEFNARWNLGSGFPFTQTQAFVPKLDFASGVTTNYTTENGDLGIVYADLNLGRLPYYHRFDVTLKHKWKINKNSTFEASGSLTNVYNRQNIFYFDRVRYKRVDQLPILPSIGLSLTF